MTSSATEETFSQLGWSDLPAWLPGRLTRPLPGRLIQEPWAPEGAGGSHFTCPDDARRAAVVVLLYPRDGDWFVPLMVRAHTLPTHPGQVCLPGGSVEPGESSQVAALRELHEELGVPVDSVTMLGPLSPLCTAVSHFLIQPWVAWTPAAPRFEPQPAEVAELLEVPLRHLLDPTQHTAHERTIQGQPRRVPHMDWQAHRIWGATAMILAEFTALCAEAGP